MYAANTKNVKEERVKVYFALELVAKSKIKDFSLITLDFFWYQITC